MTRLAAQDLIDPRPPQSIAPMSGHSEPGVAGLYAYWHSKCGQRMMPSRCDIDPLDVPQHLSEIFLAEIHRPLLRFRFRLIGTKICQRWHADFTGQWLDEIDKGTRSPATIEQYRDVAENGVPRCDHIEFASENGFLLRYWRLMLPLGVDDDAPDMILGLQTGWDTKPIL